MDEKQKTELLRLLREINANMALLDALKELSEMYRPVIEIETF